MSTQEAALSAPASSESAWLSRAMAIRGWPAVLACVVVVGLVLAVLSEAIGGGPQGPVSSSYATDADGLAAWATLLRHGGHTVVALRASLGSAHLDPADTVVVLDPNALLHSEGIRLLAFVRAGGRLIIGGSEGHDQLPALFAKSPEWSGSANTREVPGNHGGATTADISEVRSSGEGEWTDTSGYEAPLHSSTGGALLLARTLGKGHLELLADASPLQNRLLGSADNAQLALDLAGGARPVVFVESVHGFGQSLGLAALPGRWWIAFAGLALAGALWILARGRRLGGAEPQGPASQPPRAAYVQAISLLLRRTRDPTELSKALTRLRDRR
jgi:Domain of unknown function (DUF4350)